MNKRWVVPLVFGLFLRGWGRGEYSEWSESSGSEAVLKGELA